jgi:hypothetical protein
MWDSLFAIAVAAAVSLSAVNLASEIGKIHEVRHSVVVEHSMPSGAGPNQIFVTEKGYPG